MSWIDVNSVLANLTAYDSNRLKGVIGDCYFRTLLNDEKPVTEAEADDCFNKVFYTYKNNSDDVGTPVQGMVVAFGMTIYKDNPHAAVGLQFLTQPLSGALYYKQTANSNNGGSNSWREICHEANIESYIKKYLEANGYKPT